RGFGSAFGGRTRQAAGRWRMKIGQATLLDVGGVDGDRSTAAVPPTSALERDFPSAVFSRIAERESWRKEVHRPATSTHKSWAKRLGSAFRGILASAVTDSALNAVEAYDEAIALSGLTVLDPFAGSGTTLVEATKLGARSVALDINPVAT